MPEKRPIKPKFAHSMSARDLVKEKDKFTPDDFNLVFSLCCYAMGTGAGSMYIKSNAMDCLRQHFERMMTNGLGKPAGQWKTISSFILEDFRAIGRLAANLAIARGSKSIEQKDLAEAVDTVISTNEQKMEALGINVLERGGLCTL
jgi:hypothetical protein